jgi:hypothetical protein
LLVSAWIDSYAPGYIQLRPVSDKRLRAIQRDMLANGAPAETVAEGTALILYEDGYELFSRRVMREIEAGWIARFRLDDWTVRQLYGYSSG